MNATPHQNGAALVRLRPEFSMRLPSRSFRIIDHVDSLGSARGTDLAHVEIMQISLLRSVLFVALAGACVGTGQFTVAGEVAAPDLVVISPGVQVIADLDEPIFYSGNYYWRNQGGFWYRSTSHTRGWARVEVAPVEIRAIARPSAYVHYHGEARAHVSGERRGPAPPAVVRRDDKHDKDGHDKDGHDKDRHDKDGHDKDGHDKDGHDKDGHDKDDRHHD